MTVSTISLLVSTLLLVNGTPTSSSDNRNATTFQTEAQSAASNSTDPISIYNKKICKGEPTCHLIDQVPADLHSLGVRTCMCDAECSTYGDCCLDSKYYNETEQRINSRKFYCLPAFQVYAMTTCPSTYTNADIKSKCELSKIYPLKDGMKFQTPVTNTKLGLTYGNEYCALCNSMSKFQAWNVSFACYRELTETEVDTFPIHVDAKHVSFNVTKNKFVTFLNGSHFTCTHTSSRDSPDLKLRSCIEGVSTCPPGNESKLCESQTDFGYINGSSTKVYRNKYCAECNGETGEFVYCGVGDPKNELEVLFTEVNSGTMDCGSISDADVKKKFCSE